MINGNRQGSPGKSATAEDWIEHGYNPRRRSVIWNIGDPLIKQGTFYRDLYLKRKEYEAEMSPELTKMQHHRRAQRYMEKMLLKHLWQAWRR